jgi:hypothetical protein
VVVVVGETVMAPLGETVPIPLSMETDVALVVDHVNVDDWPEVIEVGLALKLTVGAVLAVPTVMLAEAFAGTAPLLSQY